jgi:hypothetical protein
MYIYIFTCAIRFGLGFFDQPPGVTNPLLSAGIDVAPVPTGGRSLYILDDQLISKLQK